MKMYLLEILKTRCISVSRLISTTFVVLAALVFVQVSFADGNLDPTFNASVTEGTGYVENTIVQPDGKIIAFGYFQRAGGARRGSIARFNQDGTLDANFNTSVGGANGSIATAELQADGKIIIGGSFTVYDGQARNRLARLNADGSLDASFNPAANFNNTILDILIQPDGKIVVCGRFNAPAGQTLAGRIVRLNADGSLDSTFINNAAANFEIAAMAYLADGKILIGGYFSNIGGTQVNFLARLNSNGSLDSTFTSGAQGNVEQINVLPDGKILICGGEGNLVARLNSDGTMEAAFTPFPGAVITFYAFGMAVQTDGKVIVGYGSSLSDTDMSVVRLHNDLTIDKTFSPGTAEYSVTGFAIQPDGKILFGGGFLSYNDQPRLYLGRLNTNGTIDAGFNPLISSQGLVRTVKRQPDGKILIAGTFRFVNGARKSNVARLNTDGSLDNTFNAPEEPFDYSYSNVFDLKLQPDGKILVGKIALLVSNLAASANGSNVLTKGGLIRLNQDGSIDESFTPGFMFRVIAIDVQPDNKILISGYFEDGSQLGFAAFKRLNQDGSFDTGFNAPQPPFTSIKEILTQPDGKILAGGTFTSTGNFPHTGTARFNANGALDANYSGIIPNVHALGLVGDGRIYVGGEFAANGNNPNRNFTRLNSGGLVDLTFNTGTGANAFVRDILVQPDGKILIGGDFSDYNGTSAKQVARVSSDGSLDTTFNTGAGASGSVYALETQPDGKILVGGQFLDFNGVEKFSLVRLQNSSAFNSTPFDFDGDRKTDISIFRPSAGEWWYQRSSDGQNSAFGFGSGTDKIAPADFTGDGRADAAVWRPSTGEWFVLRSEDFSFYSFPFGTSGDIPAPADFDGDNKADAAVFRPSSGTWYVSKSTGGTIIQQFGANGDVPTPADYDADGKADIAVFRPSSGEWWINRSTNGLIAFQFGNSNDKPVQGDYTGDGKADAAFFRPVTGEWFVLRSENLTYFSAPFGTAGDLPAPGDYDGDGKSDFTVFRPSGSRWYVQRTTAGTLIISYGSAGDIPVPGAFTP